jgi:hypothetical protein
VAADEATGASYENVFFRPGIGQGTPLIADCELRITDWGLLIADCELEISTEPARKEERKN